MGSRRKRHWWLALAILLGAAGLALGFKAWQQHEYAAAVRAADHLDFPRAEKHLRRALRVLPQAATEFLAAQVARRTGDLPLAARRLTDYEHRYGTTSATSLERALQSVQDGDIAGVGQALQDRLDRDADETPLILEALARGYVKSMHLQEALSCLQSLLARQPEHYRAYEWRGQIWLAQAQFEAAAQDFEAALAIAPEDDEARLGLAQALDQLGRPREAAAQFSCLVERQQHVEDALYGLARYHANAAEWDEAERWLAKLLEVAPHSIRARVELGRIALRRSHPETAIAELQRAVTIDPWDREAHFVLSLCLDAAGRENEAKQALARAQALETDAARAENLMARVKDHPHDADLRYQIAVLLFRLGRRPEAASWLESALQENPQHAASRAALERYEATIPPDR